MNPSGIISLITDFGLSDPYAGVMKGVVLSINPLARVIDITHQVNHGFIAQAASILEEAYSFFPAGTVHVVVVDPEVGTQRRPLAVKTENHFFVGPDNGVLWPVINTSKNTQVVHLTEKCFFLPRISQTFHGRDIFAPVAAHLSLGADILQAGALIDDPLPLDTLTPSQIGEELIGQVTRIDHFGNLLTNIHRKDLEAFQGLDTVSVKIGDLLIKGIRNTYGDGGEGEALALIGSSDCLEIAVNRGRASDRLGADARSAIGTEVRIRKGEETLTT